MQMPFSSQILPIRIHVVSFFFGLAVEMVFVKRNSMKADNMLAISANKSAT